MNLVRSFLVLPSGAVGLFVGLAVVVLLERLARNLCTPGMLDSGMCMAPWYWSVVTVMLSLGAALGAFCTVVFAVAMAPGQKREVMLLTLAIGGALAFMLLGPSTVPFAFAIGGGLAGMSLVWRRGTNAA